MKQHVPVSLFQIQKLIDLGRLDPTKPIDLTSISNTKILTIKPAARECGIQLTDEGIDIFKAKVNLEVQWIMSEAVIAAIEKAGGIVRTKYYDQQCVQAMIDPVAHFELGKPVPKNGTPPLQYLEYYTLAKNRGTIKYLNY
jgi:large subunit ribosomal protein L15